MLKREKGITLIALIITIIVMLILVGVTINVALNGGVFEKANDAKVQTQLAADREELQLAAIAALNNDLEIPNVSAIKLEGWTITGNDGGPYICKSPKENVFTVDNKGNIIEGGNGENGPVAFDWRTVNLEVDTSAYYELSEVGKIFVMNFTEDGKIIIKEGGEITETYNAADYIDTNNNGNITVPFMYNTTEIYITLFMNGNGSDIDAIRDGVKIATYTKYYPVDLTKPRVYGTEEEFYIITTDNRWISVVEGENDDEATITKVKSISEINGLSGWEVESNGNSFDLYEINYYLLDRTRRKPNTANCFI